MADDLLLSRRALSAWLRFREARTEAQVRAAAEWCGLSEREVTALQAMRANMAEAGPPEHWLRHDGNLHRHVLDTLMEGLTVLERDWNALVRFWAPETAGCYVGLMEGLAKRAKCAMREKAMAEIETPGEITEESPAPAPPPTNGGIAKSKMEALGLTLRARVRAMVERGEVDLTKPMFEPEKQRLAEQLGTTSGGLAQVLSQLRATRPRIKAALPGRTKKPSASPEQQAKQIGLGKRTPRSQLELGAQAEIVEASKELAAMVLAHGLSGVEPPELRGPLESIVANAFVLRAAAREDP